MMDATTFPLFSYLPAELRLNIWSLNLPGPRFVCLHYTSATSDPSNSSTQKALHGCTTTALIPTNLHVSREARAHALHHYKLSFNLHHSVPKIWFDFDNDVLYFPSREGWLGSWNHFVNAIAMIPPVQLGKLKSLAVNASLFRGVKGATSSSNVEANCVKEFWEYMSRKFWKVEEVFVLVEGNAAEATRDEKARIWMEGDLRCVLAPRNAIWIGSLQERLVEGLETVLKFVEEGSGWEAPRWKVITIRENESLEKMSESLGSQARPHGVLDSVLIPHSKDLVMAEQGFWIGGQLPQWHQV